MMHCCIETSYGRGKNPGPARTLSVDMQTSKGDGLETDMIGAMKSKVKIGVMIELDEMPLSLYNPMNWELCSGTHCKGHV